MNNKRIDAIDYMKEAILWEELLLKFRFLMFGIKKK